MAKIKSAIYWRWLGWRPFAISAEYKACTNAWETFILKIEYIYWILKCQNTTTCLQISEIDSQNFFCNLNNRSFHLLAFSSKFRCRLLCLIPLKTNIFKKYKNSQKKIVYLNLKIFFSFCSDYYGIFPFFIMREPHSCLWFDEKKLV